TWVTDRTTFSRFGGTPANAFYADGNVAWLQVASGRPVRYDLSQQAATPPTQQALIRTVTGTSDRRLVAGETARSGDTELERAASGARWCCGLAAHEAEDATEYQSRLEGFDVGWSRRSHEAQRDYTNLGAGTYRFHVRGRSITGAVSEEATFPFMILAPWYG